MKQVKYSAMTRPRSCGSTPSCTKLLLATLNTRPAAPVGTSSAANDQYVGINPQTTENSPKTTAATTRNRCSGRRVRRVDSSAPDRDPAAKQVVSSPNASAPTPNTSRAMSAMVTWELNVKVPSTSASPIASLRSGRDHA